MQVNRRALMGGASAVAALSASGLRATAPAVPPKLPIEVFADKPPMGDLVLSPDGGMVLARTQVKGVEMLGTYSIATHEFQNYALPKGADLRWFRWAGPDRILVSVFLRIKKRTEQLYVEGRISRLIAFDLKTQTPRFIGPKEGGGAIGDDVIFVDPAGAYLLLCAQRSFFQYPLVLKFDLATGESERVAPDLPGVFEYYCDEKGVIRAARGEIDGKWFVLYRPDADSRLKPMESGDVQLFHADPFASMSFVSGSDQGYVLSDKATGRLAAYAYDFAKRAQGDLMFAHPTNDVGGLALDERHRPLGVSYTDDRRRVHWIDPLFQDLQAGVDRAMPGRYNEILSWSDDRDRILIFSGAPNDRGRYYIFQLQNSKMSPLLDMTQGLRPSDLAVMKSVSYRARDGLQIPAFLTLPAGRDPKGLPLVIMPHGGPYGVRDVLTYDPQVQFLANRGYAVLQPNYRGSDSYGTEFGNRGDGEWGRKMQDDLDDGMDWLVGQGIVDPKRACLTGASYGGYAAAWGATRNPERYRCASCFAGVFDLGEQLDYSADFLSSGLSQQYRHKIKGARSFDLDSVSPRQLVDRLKVPVLLIHGEEDNVVPVTQSKSYHAGLTRRGKQHEFYTIPNEVHGFTQKDSFAFYLTKLDAFLAAHNPA